MNAPTTLWRDIRWTAPLSVAVGIVLIVLSRVVELPSGYGIEEYLGWTGHDAVAAMNAAWSASAYPLRAVAAAYLVADLALFLPLYGLLLITLGDVLACRLQLRHRTAARLIPGLVFALWLIDVLENLAGLVRLNLPASALLVPVAWLALYAVLKRAKPALLEAARRVLRLRVLLTLLGAAAAAALAVAAVVPHGTCPASGEWLWQWGCLAHEAKFVLARILVALLAGAGIALLLGSRTSPQARRAIADLAFRSRYVLLALTAFGVLVLGDQGRDVLHGMASSSDRYTKILVLAVSALALWTFGFACWLWTRSVGMIRTEQAAAAAVRAGEQVLAKRWARALGVAPALMVAWLCGSTFGEAVGADDVSSAWLLACFGIGTVVGGMLFVYRRVADTATGNCYYDCIDLTGWSKKSYRLLWVIGPYALPIFALAAAFALRAVALAAPSMPMAFPIVLFSLTFWLSLAGWISLFEQRQAVPWMLLVVLVIGGFGWLGWSENHRIDGWLDAHGGHWLSDVERFVPAVLLGAAITAAYAGLAPRAVRGTLRLPVALGILGAWFLASLVVLIAADRYAGGKPLGAPKDRTEVAAPNVPSLQQALTGWLTALQRDTGSAEEVPVYFVAAEGGGIRSAYWTARVLAYLGARQPAFASHTFAMSGVSGGSVGLAVYRACRLKAKQPSATPPGNAISDCIEGYGATDQLTPLLASWMFEDVLATVLPTQWCRAPACGVLSRGVAFESALRSGVESLDAGLVGSHRALSDSGRGHEPYLLLNSTWVESGERAIASEVLVDWRDFPAARDQFGLAGRNDMTLATAAHNSARFPFVNAIGAVKVPQGTCRPDAYRRRLAAQPDPGADMICGHLADGGYFDNSAGHSVADVLALLGRCLRETDGGPCKSLGEERRAWAARSLRPQVIMVRNGQAHGQDDRQTCEAVAQPSAAQVIRPADRLSSYRPGRPRCVGEFQLYANVLGPAVTALNAIGTGANGKLAEARLGHAVDALVQAPGVPVASIDLVEERRLYPLGWYLSAAARQGIREEGDDCSNYGAVGRGLEAYGCRLDPPPPAQPQVQARK